MIYQVKRTSLAVIFLVMCLSIWIQRSHSIFSLQSQLLLASSIVRICTATILFTMLIKLFSYIPAWLSSCINKLTPNIVTLGNACLLSTSIQNGLSFIYLCGQGPCVSDNNSILIDTVCNPDYLSGIPRTGCLFMFIVFLILHISVPVCGELYIITLYNLHELNILL